MTGIPAVLALAGTHHGSCQQCGEPHQPGTVIADFKTTDDRWPWCCTDCTRRRLARIDTTKGPR
ncbi:hypothetical protein [Mycolicibacter sinensis]